MILAAGAAPAFYSEVAIVIVASALVAYVCFRIGVMPIVSFLIAGALIGPQALGLVQDQELIEATAEIGVILLLFTIGIEFSLEKLARIQRLIFIGGGLQVALTVVIVSGLLLALGVALPAAIFTGFLVALSSTAIVMKLLMDRRETNSDGGQGSLGILIFQDLAVVAMVLIVPMLGGEGGTALGLTFAIGKAALIVVLVLLIARRVMPKVLESVALTCSQEIFLLAIVAICFGTAWLTSLAGVSLSLGAFLAGLVISESKYSAMVFGEILPLQILFSAAFFVSVGLLLDLGFIVANPLLILGAIACVLLIKMLATGVSMKALGYATGTTAFTSLMLAQIGEFSFVLERAGREVGLYPAGIEAGGPETFIAATVVLMMATPFMASLGERLRRRHESENEFIAGDSESASENGRDQAEPGLAKHVVIAGYGSVAAQVAKLVADEGLPTLILTKGPDRAREAKQDHRRVIIGNYERRHELLRGGIDTAILLVIADDDVETALRVADLSRALNNEIQIVLRTPEEADPAELESIGDDIAFSSDPDEVLALVSARIRSKEKPEPALEPVDLSQTQRRAERCDHVAAIDPVVPSSDVCEDCARMGDTWVHLRVCMTCGYVGCCDDSKNRHASKHHAAEGHPIVRSFEPGEVWAWCFEHEIML